jgi:hypothetical protein
MEPDASLMSLSLIGDTTCSVLCSQVTFPWVVPFARYSHCTCPRLSLSMYTSPPIGLCAK